MEEVQSSKFGDLPNAIDAKFDSPTWEPTAHETYLKIIDFGQYLVELGEITKEQFGEWREGATRDYQRARGGLVGQTSGSPTAWSL